MYALLLIFVITWLIVKLVETVELESAARRATIMIVVVIALILVLLTHFGVPLINDKG